MVLVDGYGLRFPFKEYFEKSYKLLKSSKKFYLRRKTIHIPKDGYSIFRYVQRVYPFLRKISSNKTVLVLFQKGIFNVVALRNFMVFLKEQEFFVVHDTIDKVNTNQKKWFTIKNDNRLLFSYDLQRVFNLNLGETDSTYYGMTFLAHYRIHQKSARLPKNHNLTVDIAISTTKNIYLMVSPTFNLFRMEPSTIGILRDLTKD